MGGSSQIHTSSQHRPEVRQDEPITPTDARLAVVNYGHWQMGASNAEGDTMTAFTDTEQAALTGMLEKILNFVNFGAGVDAYFGNSEGFAQDGELLLDPDDAENGALCNVLAKLKGEAVDPLDRISLPVAFVKGLYKTLSELEAHMDEADLGSLKYDDVSTQVSSLSVGLLTEGINPDEA